MDGAARDMRVVMAGGGTGGHLYPGLAVAEALRREVEGHGGKLEVIWGATGRAVDERLLARFGEAYVRQAVQPLSKNLLKLWAFWRGWRESCAYWAERFARERCDCVVALGGYAAGPAAHVAAKRGIPIVLLNPDALPGRANRFLLKRADVVVTQWELAEDYRRAVRGACKALGCPIRGELVGRTRAEGAKRLGIDAAMKTLVVTGASLGAKTINEAVVAALEDGAFRKPFESANRRTGESASGMLSGAGEPNVDSGGMARPAEHGTDGEWQIVHLAGMEQHEAVRAAYAKWPGVRAKVIDYCDDMASVWAVADLSIARAGASTCAELAACGVPAVFMPYPYHKDMHQRANAMELAKVGAAVVVEDAKDARINAGAVQEALGRLLYEEQRRRSMAEAARRAGKPHAAEEIAREIVSLTAASSR